MVLWWGKLRASNIRPAKSTHQSIDLDSLKGLLFRCVGHIRDPVIILSLGNAIAMWQFEGDSAMGDNGGSRWEY